MSDIIDDELWDMKAKARRRWFDAMGLLAAIGVMASAAAIWLAIWMQP